jgi:hypothetical protein
MKDLSLIDQLFLHINLPSLLDPIISFLDTWTNDEDDDNGTILPQPKPGVTLGEHQFIYAQYNSILFFVCYCVHHFGRQIALTDPEGTGFMRTWLREFAKAEWLDMLSDDDSAAIGIWISALFDGDGISGISDDLVRYRSSESMCV